MSEPLKPGERLLRLRDVLDRVGLSTTTLYRRIRAGEFPKPMKLSAGVSRWRESQVDGWIAEKISHAD
ncbi:MAG: AlpA family phage regulatory protein [Sphingobium sp.]|nr:AlpA family phage regulatory protein [Sphingobium sp.]